MVFDNYKKNSIDLLDCQVDLVLNSLEFYLYNYNYFYPIRKESINKEENLKVSLVRDTYEQISNQFIGLKKENINKKNNEKIMKKIV